MNTGMFLVVGAACAGLGTDLPAPWRIAMAVVFLGIMAFFHELGHFLAGKKFGVFVHEFGLGFGPPLLAFEAGETRYSLRALPLGGFVRFAGEPGGSGDRDDASIPLERQFQGQPPVKKAAIVAAGPAMNLVLASVLFFLVFSVTGIDRTTPFVGAVLPGKPAEQVGLRVGDRIVAVAGKEVTAWEEIVAEIRERPGKPTELVLERDGSRITVVVTPVEQNGVGVIGIQSRTEKIREGPAAGALSSLRETVYVVTFWIRGLIETVTGKVRPEIAGPVGISEILGEAASAGVTPFLYLLGAISANLGLINLLPVPALDGSRLLFALAEGVRGRPVDPEKENLIHFIGFAILMALFVVITYRDIMKLIM